MKNLIFYLENLMNIFKQLKHKINNLFQNIQEVLHKILKKLKGKKK